MRAPGLQKNSNRYLDLCSEADTWWICGTRDVHSWLSRPKKQICSNWFACMDLKEAHLLHEPLRRTFRMRALFPKCERGRVRVRAVLRRSESFLIRSPESGVRDQKTLFTGWVASGMVQVGRCMGGRDADRNTRQQMCDGNNPFLKIYI